MPDSPIALAPALPPVPLEPDEVVLAVFKPAARSILLGAAPWVGIVFCLTILASNVFPAMNERDLILAGIGAAASILCLGLMQWIARVYVVTSRRIVVGGGILQPRTLAEVRLARVERVHLHRHLSQQAFLLADLWVEAGPKRLCCTDLGNAKAMLDAVTDAVGRFGGRG